MLKKVFLFICFILLVSSCNINVNPTNDRVYLYTENLEQYGCWDTPYTLYVPSLHGDEYIVITDRIDYILKVQGSCNYNAIDFRRNDLIIGQIWVDSNIEGIHYNYSKNSYNEYTLQVDLLQNRGGRARYIIYHAIVPKLHPSDRVFVETRSIYP